MNYYILPFVKLLDIYASLLIVWIVLNLLSHFDIININNKVIIKVMNFLDALFNPPLKLLRKFIPILGGVDISPLVLYLLVLLIKTLLFTFIF